MLSAAAMACVAQDAKPATVTFTFDHEKLNPPHYEMVVREDGGVTYTVAGGSRELIMSSAGAAKVFSLAGAAGYFKDGCESEAKHVAFMGKKVLRYSGKAGEFSCAYNLADGDDVNALTRLLQGMQSTIAHGERMERLRRFDRLGLDEEINALEDQLKRGDACEVGLITSTLRKIVQDTQVMQRVRLKAGKMLEAVSNNSANH